MVFYKQTFKEKIWYWGLNREETTLSELYTYFENAVSKSNAFAHIERELHKIDYARHGEVLDEDIKKFLHKVVLLAKENNIILELNESPKDKILNCNEELLVEYFGYKC